MLVAVDHGNKQMKTRNLVFTSGLTESDNPPPFGDSILEYKGKYYTTSEQRIPYLRDKTVDNRFYILTLYAIACEIEAADCYSTTGNLTVLFAIHWNMALSGSTTILSRRSMQTMTYCLRNRT